MCALGGNQERWTVEGSDGFIYSNFQTIRSLTRPSDMAQLMRFCVAVCIISGTGSASKLPIREKATEMLLKLGVWAPTLSHPRPMYALPSPPMRKLYPMSSQPYFRTKALWKYNENNSRIFIWNSLYRYSHLKSASLVDFH